MDADILTTLLGLPSHDPRVEDALQRFAVVRRPELGLDTADADGPVVKSQDWVSNLSVGIEFGFQEEGALMGLDQADRGVGTMLLSEIYFYGQRPGARPYPYPLPFGLVLSDNRDTVRATMAALEGTRRSYLRDTWDRPGFRMTVSYAESGERIDFVVCMLRTEPPEPFEGGTASLPSVAAMIALLGKRVDDAALRKVFVPLGLDRQTLSGDAEQVIDFRRTYGFKLGFRKPPPGANGSFKELVLREIEYLREGEFESRGWRGELAFGIDFNDSPESALAKVGQPPANQADQDFSGHAFWEFSDYALQVVYSNMENIVLRVSVFARET